MKASEYLENVGKRINMFIQPVNRQNLKSFTDGFNLGYVLANGKLRFHDVTDAWVEVVRGRGWIVNARGTDEEMIERGMSEEQMIAEPLQIQIEIWKHLESHRLMDPDE